MYPVNSSCIATKCATAGGCQRIVNGYFGPAAEKGELVGELTEQEKRRLREKIEEARTDAVDRVIQRATELESKLAREQRLILRRVMGSFIIPPLGIIAGIVLRRRGYKQESVYVLAASVVFFLLYALLIILYYVL
jgi:hypothetical protein